MGGRLSRSAIVVVALMTLVALTGVHVLRAYGRVLVRLERVEVRLREAGFELEEPEDVPQLGLAPGTKAPAFALESLDSGRVDLDALLERARPLLLLFTSPTCGPCSLLMPAVAEWQREHADELTVALLSGGEADAVRAEASAHGLANVLRDPELATYEAYEANGTPSAVLIAADGTIGSWLAAGSDWIESLVEQTFHGSRDVAGLQIGSELPRTRLATLDGTEVVLADVVAQPTVLLFWNPACVFCRSLRQEVRAWEDDRGAGAPALIVVSSGTVEDVRSESFVSQVVLDPEWSVSSTLGAGGTPMALLVDANGRIASPVVSGGPAVLELIGARELSPTG